MIGRFLSMRRHVFALGFCVALGGLGMRTERVPLLGWVDLGVHELGHLVSYALPVPELAQAAAGSFLQVAAPLLLAVSFLLFQGDRVGGAVCLAWAATSTADVARYVADAPTQALPLIGGEHDWAFILGPSGLDALDRAAAWASTVTSAAWVLLAVGIVVAVWPGSRPVSVSVPAPRVRRRRATAPVPVAPVRRSHGPVV